MSKAVSISEGGKGRIFPQTDKLKINNVGGGNSLWLPEEEVVTGTLYADENGIHLAENDGFSCYDTVVVRVEDETDPDDQSSESGRGADRNGGLQRNADSERGRRHRPGRGRAAAYDGRRERRHADGERPERRDRTGGRPADGRTGSGVG